MKKKIEIDGRSLLFYSINLCSYGDKGDYEVFSSEELDIDLSEVKDRLKPDGGKWSDTAAQFSLGGAEITLYSEGRTIIEGVNPDTHQQAFEILEMVLGSISVS